MGRWQVMLLLLVGCAGLPERVPEVEDYIAPRCMAVNVNQAKIKSLAFLPNSPIFAAQIEIDWSEHIFGGDRETVTVKKNKSDLVSGGTDKRYFCHTFNYTKFKVVSKSKEVETPKGPYFYMTPGEMSSLMSYMRRYMGGDDLKSLGGVEVEHLPEFE